VRAWWHWARCASVRQARARRASEGAAGGQGRRRWRGVRVPARARQVRAGARRRARCRGAAAGEVTAAVEGRGVAGEGAAAATRRCGGQRRRVRRE
jgi:hypothetical protein